MNDSSPLKIYFVAGERSGDLHGGNLIYALKSKSANIRCRGFGGDYMRDAGMDLVVHYRELAFMGFAEVLANLSTIAKKIKQCKQDILTYKPDVVVLIDYAGFNLRIAKFAKQNGIKVFWYISPKVWAWNQNRAIKLKANIDRMFVILPFEKEFFKKFNWTVDYVGNPVLDAVKMHQADQEFLIRNRILSDKPLVALLPGSRKQELNMIIPLMAEVAKQNPSYQFAVATVDNLSTEFYGDLRSLPNISFISGATYDLLHHAQAAIVTSGTATLETALFNVPQVVVYRTSSMSYLIAKNLIRVPYISLVNLIAGREVVKEMIQQRANSKDVSAELNLILNDNQYREGMLTGYKEIRNILDTGSASENTAELMLHYLQASN
ncbi:MAG TPA: lipid-A-disaccharide synthase [Cyclobacteriaceae bacterium]|nr:lipid-A-disaccharide synthase [Cyclobacteriaceae bacterium]HRJ83820.1 lipid-A-disaccharide synthase [Cyclobacteriaceae bacterium]